MRLVTYLLLLFIIVTVSIVSLSVSQKISKKLIAVSSFDECVKKGYPVMESHPRQCRRSDGKLFIEQIKSTPVSSQVPIPTEQETKNIIVLSPQGSQKVGNPLLVYGKARVFENVVNYTLTVKSGVIASGMTLAKSSDVGEYGEFSIVIRYPKTSASEGKLTIFSESPQDGSQINNVFIPVQFE